MDMKDIMEQNANVQLLSLPPELRQWIWRYVFEEHSTHFHYRPAYAKNWSSYYYNFDTDKDKADLAREKELKGTACRCHQPQDHQFDDFALSSTQHHSRSLDCSILRTCRVIYHDTKLLPYRLRTFVFRELQYFKSFIRVATMEQLGAVRRLTFVSTFFESHTQFFPPAKLMSHFKGLAEITLLGVYGMLAFHERPVNPFANREVYRYLTRPPITKARICLTRDSWSEQPGILRSPEEILVEQAATEKVRQWSRDFERFLEGRLDEEDGNEGEDEKVLEAKRT